MSTTQPGSNEESCRAFKSVCTDGKNGVNRVNIGRRIAFLKQLTR